MGDGLDGGSFASVQQWLHDIERFQRLSPGEQDDTVGRSRIDNEELEDAPDSAHVKRTAQRPVTSGQIPVKHALAFGALLALLAFGLVLSTNPPTIALSFAALAVAVAYPYAKRLVAMPQAVLGVAFSFGIPMAFSAVLGPREWSLSAIGAAVPPHAWWLLLGNLFWVLAYDTEYAMVDRDDDLKIGIKTSAITFGRFDVAAVMAFYAVYLASWALLGRQTWLLAPAETAARRRFEEIAQHFDGPPATHPLLTRVFSATLATVQQAGVLSLLPQAFVHHPVRAGLLASLPAPTPLPMEPIGLMRPSATLGESAQGLYEFLLRWNQAPSKMHKA